ncbi:MAG: hypothetical protein PHR28_03175 [candidate division Zixibacteria bacterium]|jgi:hypothetical protein|nr:hypothetical protein [candidate division Zixibacteria bacterium]
MWIHKTDLVDFAYGEMTVDEVLADYLPDAVDRLENDQCIVIMTAHHGLQTFSNTNVRGSASVVPTSDVVEDCALGYWLVTFRNIEQTA